MGVSQRGPSFGGCKRIFFTACYIITWGLLLMGTIMCHMAVVKMIGPIGDLPDNIKKGFYDVLKFDQLDESAETVRSKARDAVRACEDTWLQSPSESQCPGSEQDQATRTYAPPSATTTAEKAAIDAEFTATLNTIDKVVNDKYFGVSSLQSTADDLNAIQAELATLQTENADCRITTPSYCRIYKDARDITTHLDDVTKAIDDFYDNDAVTEFTEHKGKLVSMHALPYILVASMVFFFYFWYKDARCRSMSKAGCAAVGCHVWWWLVFIIWNSVMVALGLAAYMFADDIEIPGEVLKGDPTYKDLVDHVETEYPEFYNTVFDPLSNPFKLFLYSGIIFEIFCVVIVIYGCCVCCWTPYVEEQEDFSNA